MDLTFKTTSTPQEISTSTKSDFVQNEHGITENYVDDSEQMVVNLIGLGDVFGNLPPEVKDHVKSISKTLGEIIEKRGLQPSSSVYARLLNELRDDMGIDRDTEPAIVLDKIGRTLNAWKEVSFMRDINDRRRVFMKLAKASSSKEMDGIILDIMEKYGQ